MKIKIYILVILLSSAAMLTAREDDNSYGIPFFSVITPAYPTETADTARLEIIIKVPFEAVQFLKTENGFEANYEVSVSIFNGDGIQLIENIWRQKLVTQNFNKTVSSKIFRFDKKIFYVSPSKINVIAKITDLDTHKSSSRKVALDLEVFSQDIILSDLLLIDNNQTANEIFPMGIPAIPAKISDSDTMYYLYYEARVDTGKYTLHVISRSDKDEIINQKEYEKVAYSTLIKDIMSLDNDMVSQNNIKITLKLEQKGKFSSQDIALQVKWSGLTTHISDINEAIDQLMYISDRKQLKEMRRAQPEKRELLFKKFWQSKDPTPGTTENELMDEYYRRVKYANEKFGTFQNGWKTDIGMIFILFGPPDDIEVNLFRRDGKSYQKWSYYIINKNFIFVDHTGFGDYELLEPYYSPYGSTWR